MSTNPNRDVMRDYAGDDPRSVRAWLRDKDDGRGLAYEIFHRELVRRDPTVPEDEMEIRYHAALQDGWLPPKKKYHARAVVGCALYAALLTYYLITYR